MSHALFTQDLTHAFISPANQGGVEQERYEHWVAKLLPMLPRIKNSPQREARPLLELPDRTDDLAEIEEIAGIIASRFKTLLVVGMGGSSLSGETLNFICKAPKMQLKFLDNIDPFTIGRLCESMDWKNTAILVISKSGNTVETLAQMSVLLRSAKAALGDSASSHFVVITIANDNPLHAIAKAHGIRVLAHCADLGGRFSILSSVGLIPAAAIGMDIRKLRAGAKVVLEEHFSGNARSASAVMATAVHMGLMEKQVRVNVMMHYVDRLGGLANWYRQCWGESLGKCAQATTPVRSRGTTDQHSQLQLYLDGPKDKFFTLMLLESGGQTHYPPQAIDYPASHDARLAFLSGHTLGNLMVAEQQGTLATMVNRGCPLRTITLSDIDEASFGALLMHFSLEIMFVAELLGVNAFDQPAVEDSKVLALQYLAGISR